MVKTNMARTAVILTLILFGSRFTYAAEEPKPAAPEAQPAADEPKPLGPGLFSLDSSVGVVDNAIDQGRSAVEKFLGIGISGFFDSSWTWASTHPGSANGHHISGRYFDQDYNQLIFNNFNLTLDKPEKDWGVGFHLVGDFGRTGQLLRQATLWHAKLQREGAAELREAFFTFTIPIGEGLQVKGGKFVTPMGTEILPAPGAYNDNISRSFAFNFGVPITHTGAMFTYPFTKILSANAALITGWDNPNDNNSAPSFMGGVNFTPADAFALASNLMVGPEQKKNTNHTRVTWSNVATIKPVDPVTIYFEYTLGHEQHALTPVGQVCSKGGAFCRDAWWHAFAGILSYGWTDRFTTAGRLETFIDSQAARTGGLAATNPVSHVNLGEMTLTAAYKFTAKLLGRAELRQDWANKSVFLRRNAAADKAQTTLALQAIYGF
jgi:hypothetical protein